MSRKLLKNFSNGRATFGITSGVEISTGGIWQNITKSDGSARNTEIKSGARPDAGPLLEILTADDSEDDETASDDEEGP